MKKSLNHFESPGFKTLSAAFHDGDSLENPKRRFEALDATPGA